MVDMNRFTNKAQDALLKAQAVADEYGHTAVEPLHVAVAVRGGRDAALKLLEHGASATAKDKAMLSPTGVMI
mgnify:CR=1 FL=1